VISKIESTVRKRNQKLQAGLNLSLACGDGPLFGTGTRGYELSEKTTALHCGGLGLVQEIVKKSGLAELINDRVRLLKIKQPYRESDHVLNLVYNFLCGGECLDDLKLLRENSAYLDALNVNRIPDSTTAGDFLRRFGYDDNLELLDAMNEANGRIWKSAGGGKKAACAVLDVDSSVKETYGEDKEKMDISYNGKWGFHPLLITESETNTHVCLVNRSGNEASQTNAAYWIEYSVAAVEEYFEKIYIRGDSAFSLTYKFDEWDGAGLQFVFGTDSTKNLREKADNLPQSHWKKLNSRSKQSRQKPKTEKQKKVETREFRNMRTENEWISEFEYTPSKCQESYRIIVLKKDIRVTKGQQHLFDKSRYFFYITNIRDMSAREVLDFIRKRCNHENKVEQLKNGVPAFYAPCSEFHANWAWMIAGALAWNIKSWIGLLFANPSKGREITRMEFKRFMNNLIFIPCQILKSGRMVVYRFLNVNSWFLDSMKTINRLKTRPAFH